MHIIVAGAVVYAAFVGFIWTLCAAAGRETPYD